MKSLCITKQTFGLARLNSGLV